MVATVEPRRVSLRARDVARQRLVRVRGVPVEATVGEVVEALVGSRMNLPRTDAEGRPLVYHARLDREGRHLHASEHIGDVIREETDTLVLQPNIQAG